MGEIRIADISEHNGYLDFTPSNLARYEGFIIRAGYGVSTVDNQFKRNIEGLKAIGKKVGIYWFGYAGTEAQARVEAHKCHEVIKDYELDLPVFYDWEYDSEAYNNRCGIYFNKNDITKICVAFLEEMRKLGYRNLGVYYNLDYQTRKVDVKTFRQYKYKLWYAQYSSARSDLAGDIDIWQYSSKEYVKNIYGVFVATDANIVVNERIFNATEEKKEEQKIETKNDFEQDKGFIKNCIYTVQVDGLRVRTEPFLNARIKQKYELTSDGQKHAFDNGTLRKGTKVTCLDVSENSGNTWLKIPSGWICAVFKTNIYVK